MLLGRKSRGSHCPGARGVPDAPQPMQPTTWTALPVSLYSAMESCVAGSVGDCCVFASVTGRAGCEPLHPTDAAPTTASSASFHGLLRTVIIPPDREDCRL